MFVSIRRMTVTGLLALLFFMGSGCEKTPDTSVTLQGNTQGTTYHIVIPRLPGGMHRDKVHLAVENLLKHIDLLMSNYKDSSQLSKFNRAPVNQWIDVDSMLADVVSIANSVAQQSDGALDITVAPLVDLWGFGPVPHAPVIPDSQALAAARAMVNAHALQVRKNPPALLKQQSLVIDLSAIGPGYTVDRIADLLESMGIRDYLIELGGEDRVAGKPLQNDRWRIGIEQPGDTQERHARHVVNIARGAVATSGDYRDFFEIDGKRYSHTIDPRTGFPVTHSLASITVIRDTCAEADAWATALNVLGPEQGFVLAEKLQIPVLMVLRQDSHFETRMNSLMKAYVETVP